MASQCSIDEPRLVCNLPRPLEPSSGSTSYGPVYTCRGSRKRKRSEIVVAADGESINVFSIKTSRQVTNHAIPPRTFLTAPPCCIHQPATRQTLGNRLTYAATRNQLDSDQHVIVGYGEELPKSIPGRSPAVADTLKTERRLGCEDDPVVFLAPFVDVTNGLEILALQQNGEVTIMSNDLEEEKARASLRQRSTMGVGSQQSGDTIAHASLEDAETVTQGALKDQPEMLARLLPSGQGSEAHLAGTEILCVVLTPPEGNAGTRSRTFEMWAIRSQDAVPSAKSRIQHIGSWTLPLPSDSANTARSFSFQPRTGVLQCSTDDTVDSYDISELVVRRRTPLARPRKSIVSALAFKGAWCLSNVEGEVGIYDQQYQSLQAAWNPRRPDSAAGSRARSYAALETLDGPIRLLEYLPNLQTVLAVSNHRLVTFDVKLPRKRTRTSDVSKGAITSSFGRNYDSAPQKMAKLDNEVWSETREYLDQLAYDNDAKSYEDVWSNAMQDDTIPLDLLIALTLSHIFSTPNRHNSSSSSSPLQIPFLPYKVFSTLLVTGRITPQTIQRAIQMSDPNKLLQPNYIDWPRLIRAIETHDPSLLLLSDFIELSQHLPPLGLIHTLSSLLRSFHAENTSGSTYSERSILPTPSTPGTPRTPNGQYTNGFSHNNKTASVAAEQQSHEIDENALTLAESALEHASTLLESGLEHRSIALQLVLRRLAVAHRHDSTTLAPLMRQHLPPRELGLLVDLLQGELQRGGWSDPIMNYAPNHSPSTPSNDKPQDDPLASICALLSASISALGTSGFLSATPSTDTASAASDLIPSLRHSTSAVLESIQESTFLSGFLRDFLRYHQLLVSQSNGGGGGAGKHASAVTTQEEQDGMLPIGLAKATDVERTKMGLDGEVRARSKREMAYQRSRRVGRYAFERLDV
ncbi:MAG: hypothetical protein M1828_005270 [Chrysothrix sp. TS-e1954]|nr:MAG: hypothetical protein M1828_005270 [Chrysothrix sp. TS-e1954]